MCGRGDSPSDHLPVTLTIEGTEGERGHERRQTVRGDLMADIAMQNLIIKTVDEAYGLGGSVEDKNRRFVR